MILLTGMLHRSDLKDIIFRWMCNQLFQEDCERIKKIINFNVYIVNLYLDAICSELFSYLSERVPWTFEVTSKGQLKEFVLRVAPVRNQRIEYLEERFRKYPEDFFCSSPFHGKIYCCGSHEKPTYLGHSRVKRFRRVAEKASRRMINIIFNQIKKRADDLAFERASRLGIPKDQLFTPLEQQAEEFAHAERRFIKELKKGLFHPSEEVVQSASIHDYAGIKVILPEDRERSFEDFFNTQDSFSIVEKQRHAGIYNAVNYIIEYKLDKNSLIGELPNSRVVHVLSTRGMDKNTLLDEYRRFIETSEDTVFLEVITSNFFNMIESELGHCMHEERILSQREQVEYRSSIARNVRYITEYMFLFAISGKSCIQELPIKLWEKAMPDTYDHAIRELWDIPTMPVI
jgi:hypothetical protein